MNGPCCERQIPQDEALYKSRSLRADDPLSSTPALDLQLLEIALKMKCPCCERQIPQDEALYKSCLLRVLNLCTRFIHQTVDGDQTVHGVSARFRKTRRYTKVICCVLNLCTRIFHQTGHGDQTVHAMSAGFRKTRHYTKVVCGVLKLCTRSIVIKPAMVIKPSML